MAFSSISSVFLVVFVTISCTFWSASSSEVAGSPESVQKCEKIVSDACGKQVHSYVFNGVEGEVSLYCCIELAEIGKSCHDSFLAANLASPVYKSNSTEIINRNSKIWNQCVSELKGDAPPEKCARMHDGTCGKQIVNSIFHNVGELNDTCCGELIVREKECHDSLTQARIASGGFESNKTQVLEKSTAVWNRCATVAQSLPDVKSCKAKVSNTCGAQVGLSVLFGKGAISKDCCIQLLKLGRDCHDLLALTDVAQPANQAHSKDILDRNAKVWISCVEQLTQ